MVHFLFGKPGTGKTYTVASRFRDEAAAGERPVYLIVPEQSVYTAERSVLSTLPPEAGRVHPAIVVSFSRLCDMMADRYGGRTFGSLSRASSLLLMWRNLRELRGVLETYNTAQGDDTSLCRLMLAMTVELSCNVITPAQLEAAAARLGKSSPLRAKLRDIALVCAAYDGLVQEICGDNPADRLIRTASMAAKHGFFEGASVYLDGFTSFTAQEYALLRPVLAQAKEVTITVSAAGRREQDLPFESIRDTLLRLTRLCEDMGQTWDDEILSQPWRTQGPELLALEQELWQFGLTPEERRVPPEEGRGAVRLITAPNLYEEAQAAALHIGELHNGGIPYGQIALVVRDTEQWRGVVDAALEQANIPYFLSERRGLCDRPAARLLLTALRCIRRGYQTEDVISLCKTGLCRVSLSDLDCFADYTETWRIRGEQMKQGPFNRNPDGYTTQLSPRGKQILEAANRVREAVIPPLVTLENRLALASDTADQCRALFAYLCDLSVKEQLSDKARTLLGLGKHREAGETVRLWSFLTSTLSDIATLLPAGEEGGPLTCDDLSAALSLVFEETDIGAVPARHDCVTVGSADTVRLENVQAMLMLGLCEGEFPRAVSDAGLLTEQDKETLSSLGIQFDTRVSRLASEELLYVYRAMTKPAKELLLFTHNASPDGSAKAPSAAYTRVLYLFPYLEPIRFSAAYLEDAQDALPYTPPDNDSITPDAARRVLGENVWLSHTSLQAYARCPYRFYTEHVLRLREKTVARMDSLSSGNFLHHVMEVFLGETVDGEGQIRHMTEEEIDRIADRIMTDYIYSLCGDIEGNGRLLHLFARLRSITLVLVRSVQKELEQGSFLPIASEWDTRGRRPGDPQPMVIPLDLPDGLLPLPQEEHQTVNILMGGKIDRVDVFREGDIAYIRVIDYKSSCHIFSEKKMFEDMNVQLLLYLFTLCAPRNRGLFADREGRLPKAVLPAEVLYLSPTESPADGSVSPVRSGLIINEQEVLRAASADLDTDYLPGVKRDTKTGELKGTALCSTEHMALLDQEIQSAIREVASAMYQGSAARTPGQEACRFCAVRTSCPLAEYTDR